MAAGKWRVWKEASRKPGTGTYARDDNARIKVGQNAPTSMTDRRQFKILEKAGCNQTGKNDHGQRDNRGEITWNRRGIAGKCVFQFLHIECPSGE